MTDCEITSMPTTPGGDKVPKRAIGNRQIKTTTAIIRFLREEGEAATTAIHEYLNDQKRSRLRYGCTMPRVVNLLGKMPDFEEVGTVYLKDRYYEVKVWRLAEWV